jgi:hypothetical protein
VAPLRAAGGAAAALAVALAGCSFGTDDPAETVEDFRDAVAAGDVPAACEEIVPDAQVLFYPEPVVEDGVVAGYRSGCTDPERVVLDEAAKRSASGTEVISSEVEGDTARVETETAAGEELVFDLVRIDERWRIKAPAELLEGLDSEAKTGARRAQTAMEAYAARDGRYTGADVAALRDIEPSLNEYDVTTVTGSGDTYEVGVTSASGTEFVISRDAGGTIASTCDQPELGGCARGGIWTELVAE